MNEDEKRPEENNEDRPEVEEVVTDFGDVRVRSGFEIEEVEPGIMDVNIFGPVFEFLDNDDLEAEALDFDDEDDS